MRILFVTSEIHPLIKTGGLADVSASLPAALQSLDIDIRILVPGYPRVLSGMKEAVECASLPSGQLVCGKMPDTDVPVFAIDHPELYWRSGNPYLNDQGVDWPDNASRFGLLSKTAALLASENSPVAWKPEIVHGNDWQSGLAPAFMHFSGSKAKSLMTVHNLAFQGNFSPDWVARLGLPAYAYAMHGVEFHGHFSFLKAGLYYCNTITTVSPSYALEIQTPEMGCGMDGLLRSRKNEVYGILNGIDLSEWNPEKDPYLNVNYDAASLDSKIGIKRELQLRLGLEQKDDAPLLGVVSRLTYQKGLDLVAACADWLVAQGAQIAVLGSGDREFEQNFLNLAKMHPGRCAASIGYDESLAHQVMAGSDIFLMPSRFEPCGLNQMYGMRYGTPPVVRKTGGLADSVRDGETGFVFERAEVEPLRNAISRAIGCYREKESFRKIQMNGMERNFDWQSSAKSYADLYKMLTA